VGQDFRRADEYGDTRTLDPATWTADERERLIEFFRILLEWEAARPQTDANTDDQKDQARADDRGRDRRDLHARLEQRSGT
jgi:hypothetical protein